MQDRFRSDDADATMPGGEAAAPKPERLRTGDHVGRYTITGEIGAGAMGVVYSAHDPELDRKIALKAVERLPHRRAGDRKRFLAEARTLAKLSSPNIVAVFDVGVVGGGVFIAMEHVPGPTLHDWLKGDRERVAVVQMFVQAGRGLADAHGAGIVHGDFKPANVVVDDRGRARVLDFGMARVLEDADADEDGSRLTAGLPNGTPAYMAPELFAGGKKNAKTDQFAFCVALWEGLTGARPFVGATIHLLLTAVAEGNIQPMPSVARVPAWLERTLRRGLAVNPADRWASMEALLRELSQQRLGRRNVIVGVFAVGATWIAWALGASQDARAACTRTVEARARVWDADRATAVRAAISSADVPYAAHAADRVDAVLSDYHDSWIASSIDVCATPKDERAPALRAAAQACLEDDRRRFDALATALLQVSAEDVERVTDAAEQLPGIDDCTNDVRLGATVRGEPDDPTVRREVRAIQDSVSRIWALSKLARRGEAAELAAAALLRAEATGFKPAMLETYVLLGSVELALEHHQEADAHLRRGYELAVELGNPAEQMAAALDLALLHGLRGGDIELGREWLFHANALRVRPEVDDDEQARFHFIAAQIDQADRHVQDAIAHQLRALDIVRRIAGEDAPLFASHSLQLAHLLRKQGKVDTALDLQERAAEVLRGAYGDDHPQVAEAANAGALIHLRSGRLDEATAQFERALDIWRRTLPEDHPTIAFALTNLCSTRADSGDLSGALAFCEQALAVRGRSLPADHPVLAYTRTDRAELLRRAGRVEQARSDAVAAVATLERRLGSGHPNLGDPLTVLGRALLDLDRPDEAVETLRRALAARDATDYERISGETAATKAALAFALMAARQDLDEARRLATEALEALSRVPKVETSMLARDEARLRAWLEGSD